MGPGLVLPLARPSNERVCAEIGTSLASGFFNKTDSPYFASSLRGGPGWVLS